MSRSSYSSPTYGSFDGHGWKCDSCTRELRRSEDELKEQSNRLPLPFPDEWWSLQKGLTGNSDQAFPESKHICQNCALKLFNGDLRSIPAQMQQDRANNPAAPQASASDPSHPAQNADQIATDDQVGKAGRQ